MDRAVYIYSVVNHGISNMFTCISAAENDKYPKHKIKKSNFINNPKIILAYSYKISYLLNSKLVLR